MTSPRDRSNTAVLVIDVQNDVVAAAHERDAVVANINEVVAKARAAGAPVVWVQHDDEGLSAGTDGWKIVPELAPRADELVVFKNFRDSFEATTLEDELDGRGVGKLVVTGAQSDFCVRWTLHSALSRGYDTVLIADAHTTDEQSAAGWPGAQIVEHTNAIWQSQADSGCTTTVVAAADLEL